MVGDDRGDDESTPVGVAATVPLRKGHDETSERAKRADDVTTLGERPGADPLARAVAKARIGDQLFGTEQRVKLGRYHLLELVGAGGMGVVWGGWDPELERRVAIKLVKETLQEARNRILIEGQALAKLSHPNVVAVYDVGVVEEQVYLVMEWVRGKNLRSYCATARSAREIVAIYRAAGEGLLAAHRAGLIHRDFKPDNAVLGEDGRVRVLDFGLARDHAPSKERAQSVSEGAGTPRYMPPEQAEGGALTPAVDQFAFCVSLREALAGRGGGAREVDIPSWLDVIITRGSQPDAGARYPSMAELLRDLGRDPATVWRRRLVVAGAGGAVAAAFIVGNMRGSGATEVEPCVGGSDEIAGSWNPNIQARMVAHLAALGPYGEEVARTLPEGLRAYSVRWAAEHRKRCLAFERGELTQPLYTLGCFARVRAGFETAVSVLSSTPADRLSAAVIAMGDVPEADHCSIEAVSSTVTPPSPGAAPAVTALASEIERVRALARADDPKAPAAASAVVERATALGYKPVLARAQLAAGFALALQKRGPEAVPLLDRAAANALESSDDVTFVEAYARELYVVGTTRKDLLEAGHEDIAGAIPYVERVAIRLGASAVFERSLLFNNIGTAHLSKGDPSGARAWFDRAITESRDIRGRSTELVATLGNRALVAETAEDRDRWFRDQRDTLTKLLGANHSDTLGARVGAAMFSISPQAAADGLREPCALLRRYHAETTRETIADCTYQLGWLAEERGDLVEARAMMTAIDTELSRAYLLAFDGALEPAARAAREYAASAAGEWWNKLLAVDASMIAAVWFDRAGRPADAIGDVDRALALMADVPLFTRAPFAQRRLARTQALAARLVAAGDPKRARQLATAALSWYRTAAGYERSIAELDRLLARLPP